MISQLSVTKHGQAGYSPYADVDRNGVINGGDRQRAQANLGATAPVPAEENPLEVSLPTNALQLAGGSSKTFNTRNGLRWSLTGAEFDLTPADVVVLVNGSQVPAGQIVITDHLLTANVTLADGRNEVSMKAYDTVGPPAPLQRGPLGRHPPRAAGGLRGRPSSGRSTCRRQKLVVLPPARRRILERALSPGDSGDRLRSVRGELHPRSGDRRVTSRARHPA